MFNAFETTKTAAFNKIYYATHQKLHCIVLNLCRDSDQTLDILQKVYLKLWEKWDDILDKTDLSPLLFTYCKNIYIDEIRRTNCGRVVSNTIKRTAEIHGPSVESEYGRKEYLEVVNTVLLRLTSRRREVIKLYLEEGLTRKKLSERLCISPNTIDNHLRESLSLLRHELQLYLKTGID